LPSGDVEYLGRADFQIKIRGFRIEAGEIENALRAQGAIRDVVVLAREDVPGDKRLVAYLIARDPSAAPAADELREHLRPLLPEYMIPSAFVACERFPLTANGKLDRAALPVPVAASVSADAEEDANEVETWLATTWADLLRVERVALDDNFFDLGGHSLLLTQLIVRIRAELGIEVSLRTLFERPTVRELGVAMADDFAEAQAMLAEIEGMSPDEVAALLETEEA
jgi:acyl carrier protein